MKLRRASMVLGACGVLAGCAADRSVPAGVPAEEGGVLVNGDWDDVDAAVEAAVSKVQMTVVSSDDGEGSGPWVYQLVTITDEPARLVVRRPPGSAAPARVRGTETLQIEASVGRFGNPRQERALIAALRERLGDLAGVDFAPIR